MSQYNQTGQGYDCSEETLNNRTIQTVFQPAVNLSEQKIDHIECLARIGGTDNVTLPIKTFIDGLGSVEQAEAFDLHVIDLTIAEHNRARAQFRSSMAPISVNVMTKSLNKDGFIEKAIGLVNDKLDAPQGIMLEIPFEFASTNIQTYEQIATELSRAGIAIVLDDFVPGTIGAELVQQPAVKRLKVAVSNADSFQTLRAFYSRNPETQAMIVAKKVELIRTRDKLKDFGLWIQQGLFFKQPDQLNNIFQWFEEAEATLKLARLLDEAQETRFAPELAFAPQHQIAPAI